MPSFLAHVPAWPVVLRLVLCAAGAISYLFSLHTHRLARRNLVALRKAGKNGRLELVARNNVRDETIRVMKSIVLIVVGLALLAFPPRHVVLTFASVTVTVGFITVGFLIAAGAVVRKRFYAEFEHLTLVERRTQERGDQE